MRDGIIYDCPSVNCKTPIYTGKCRKDCLEKRNKELGINPQTNADRIRAMSDEALAEFRAGGHCPPSRRFPDCATIEPCSKCWLEYLKQPVKDGDDDG